MVSWLNEVKQKRNMAEKISYILSIQEKEHNSQLWRLQLREEKLP